MEVRDIEKIQGMMKEPFVDSERIFDLFRSLAKAYNKNSREDIWKAAKDVQKYIDEGGDIDFDIPDEYEDYEGDDCMKLSLKYILRVLHDRYCDTDSDQVYIATGLPKSMRMTASEEIQIIGLHEQFKELDRQQSQRKRIISATQLSLNF